MDFGWTAAQNAYRARLRDFIARTLPDDWPALSAGGVASPEQIAYSRVFCAALAAEGLLIPHWPEEFGGAGASPWEQFILAEEVWGAGEPRGPQYMNVNWLGPTLMRFGTPGQQAEHLGRIAEGRVIWCQGYSEPNAGTDLAALQTRAVRDGDDYVVNGAKVWTSYAYQADWCFLLARTASERKAISILLVKMDSPGITVTPIPAITEHGHLNEVFFTDVRVPVANRMGEEGRAWEIITYALSFERVGIPRYHTGRLILEDAVGILRRRGAFASPIVRARAARIVAKLEASRLLTYQVVDQRAKGHGPTVEANIQRVAGADATQDLLDFIAEYVPDALTGGHARIALFYRGNIASTIAAGTYEIQLNLIAQQALGLPRGH